jgi:hypothetical protein
VARTAAAEAPPPVAVGDPPPLDLVFAHPLGVRYWSLWGAAYQEKFLDTETLGPPWMGGDGELRVPVRLADGSAAWVEAFRVRPLPVDPAKDGPANEERLPAFKPGR